MNWKTALPPPEEQAVLSRYVGWGGIPQAFEEGNDAWASEFLELYTALSPEEYEAARASTLNAHYTSPTVIKAIYKCIENMGFTTGNVLEPSCGIGNFFGLLPESMKNSKLYGVELDPITGRIARQLYQTANIAIEGFEETSLPDSFFDLAIGNVPFGDYGVADKRYDKHRFLIHDYFFAKTLDKMRPGGVVAFITSSGTMDKKNPAVRKYIAERAELLEQSACRTMPFLPMQVRAWSLTFCFCKSATVPFPSSLHGYTLGKRSRDTPSTNTLWIIPTWCWVN